MPLDVSSLIPEVRAVALSVWPELASTGIFAYEQSRLVPWTELVLPYAVIVANTFTREDWGKTVLAFGVPVSVFYVLQLAGAGTPLTQKCQALINACWPAQPFTSFQRLDIPSWGSGEELAPNQAFLKEGSQRWAGRVEVRVLVGTRHG